jgi:ABC-type antimicrobial peptide transport system permease subunit
MDEVVASSTSVSRVYLLMFGLFSGLALVIVNVGVYGVASYLVATRRRELAVRRALGATSLSIVGLVLKEGTLLALAGVAVGVAGALALSGLIGSLLFGVTSRDPLTFVLMPAAIALVTILANVLPIGGALRENPVVALRN